MTSYWLSFRLRDSKGYQTSYQQRLDSLHAEIEAASGGGKNWWLETTSFYVFNSNETIAGLYARVVRAIDIDVDLVVIGMNDFKGGWIIGHLKDQDIFSLVPGMQKL